MMSKSGLVVSALFLTGTFAGCRVQMTTQSGDQTPSAAPSAAPAPTPSAAPAPSASASASAAPVTAPPAGKVETKGDSIKLPGNIVFDTGKATLTPNSGSDVVLGQLKQFMVENEKTIAVIRVEGHTDNQGTADANLELSGQRALTIKKWLVDSGIDAKRLLAVGFGQTKPIVPNDTDEHKAQNRRTEFKIAETYDKSGKPRPYLGLPPLAGGKEFK